MPSIPFPIVKYLQTRSIKVPWKISGTDQEEFDGVVMIPVLAKSQHILATLASLAQNLSDLLIRFLILAGVKHRLDLSFSDKLDSQQNLQMPAEKRPS